MKTYLLPSDNILSFITKLAESGSVYYPILDDEKMHLHRFDKEKEFAPTFEKIRTSENIKHFLFPSRDMVAKFPKDAKTKSEQQYLFGVKNCDLRGVDVYDRVFMAWEPTDPTYKRRRENTTIISADCPEPEDCCFCNLVGLTPFGESVCDINFTQISSGLLFEAFTKRGEEIISSLKDFFKDTSEEDLKERNKVRKSSVAKLNKINNKNFKENLSERIEKAGKETMYDARKDCVECFACLHACPTCYCFLLSDYKKGKDIARVRTWDACYYAAYARVGGGANPRSKLDERFWNRFLCKFNYFYQYEKYHACSGCGRCLRGCSGKIDIREILWKL
jgi:NAD-dependent dihydropyrimidine dehydrogenase PreA subunit